MNALLTGNVMSLGLALLVACGDNGTSPDDNNDVCSDSSDGCGEIDGTA